MMKPSLPTLAGLLLMAALLSMSNPGYAQDNPLKTPNVAEPKFPTPNVPKTPLAEQMSGISKDLRSLRKIMNDPAQKTAAVQLVKDMQDRATKAKGFDPSKTKDIPPADRDQFLTDYQKQIEGLISDFQKLETAVNDGKSSDASALLDKLQTDKREGHKKFNAEE
jgi:soluble cytochrome b562